MQIVESADHSEFVFIIFLRRKVFGLFVCF